METSQSKHNSPNHSISQPCNRAQLSPALATVAKRLGLLAITIGLAFVAGSKTVSDSKINPHNWRPPGMLMSIALLALLLATSACSVIRVYDPQSGKVIYESKRLGNSLKIGEVRATTGTNSISIHGYVNDQVQAFQAATTLAKELLSKAP